MSREDFIREKKLETEPKKLLTVEDFRAYQKKFAEKYEITDEQIELLLSYHEGHGYVIGAVEAELYRGDLEYEANKILWEEYSMDDIIDAVCDWNYELILDMDMERQNPRDMIDFCEKQNKYDSLKKDEILLDELFEQTKYRVEVEELATQLVNEFIVSMEKSEENAVQHLVEQVQYPITTGRAR